MGSQRNAVTAASSGWVPRQLVELKARIDAAGNWSEALTLTERNAVVDLRNLAYYVNSDCLTPERGEEFAALIMDDRRFGTLPLTSDESAKVHGTPMPGITVDHGEGPKPVTPDELDASLAAVARRQVPSPVGTRTAPRAREGSTRRSSRSTNRGGDSGDSDSEPPPVSQPARTAAVLSRLRAHVERRQRRRFENYRGTRVVA